MVKQNPTGKRAKISQAQQLMILAVFGAAVFLGTAIAVVISSINRISFSANVIMAQDQSITSFSDTIKNIGICKKPSGQVYSDKELQECTPNNVKVDSVPNTLRSTILEDIASNKALASVPNDNDASCINPDTQKNYTYKELEDGYKKAEETNSEDDIAAAVKLIKTCSSLRIIPDALPAYKNEEALLASVDKVFRDSGTEPEALTPTDETEGAPFGISLYTISVSLSIESNAGVIHRLLNNLEHSIRNFNIQYITMEWQNNDAIDVRANADAYFMSPSQLTTTEKMIKSGGK